MYIFLFFTVFIFAFLRSRKAHAYLDPGTGNVLVFAIISIFTTLVYFIKNIVYALKGRMSDQPSQSKRVRKNNELVIFSEGKIYWGTFKPIVEALIKKQFPFRYLSMDVEDPALCIENEYMDSSYIGMGSAAFARAAAVRAKIMLQTTPNIGTPGYPMPVPRHISKLVHVLHGFGGMGYYYKNALDSCDLVLGINDFMEKEIRKTEEVRGINKRQYISAGLPYLDSLGSGIIKKEGLSNPPVILVAPSWGEKNCLGAFGDDFIGWLLNAGYKVILRPHPFSFKAEKDFILSVKAKYKKEENFYFDDAISGAKALSSSDLLISDKSGVRFDFAFLYERPVITLDVPLTDIECFEVADMGFCWDDEEQHKIGKLFSHRDFRAGGEKAFLKVVAESLEMDIDFFAELRKKSLANYPHSGEFIAEFLIGECQSLRSE